jgi:hypothetical protein
LLLRKRFVQGDARNEIPVQGAAGVYRVVLTFARPGYLPVAEDNFSFDPNIPGDSHLAIAPPALVPKTEEAKRITGIEVEAQTEFGTFVFMGRANERGFLGRLETEIQADTFADAEQRAYNAIAPNLSQWSAELDIPMHVWRIHVTAMDTGSMRITCANPYYAAHPVSDGNQMSPEFRWFASLYREALESNSVVYEYLCLFKIAEGILHRRARLGKEAKSLGQAFTRPVEEVPEDPSQFEAWLNDVYPQTRQWDEMSLDTVFRTEARGRRFGDLLKHELNDLRDDIGHALSDKTGVMEVSADETLHLRRVREWLALMKVVVRRMLKNEFPKEFLSAPPTESANAADEAEPGAGGG